MFISESTRCTVIIYEYPQYGLCKNQRLCEETIYHNITIIHDYVKNNLGFKPKDIFLYGNSVGSGPSCYLAAKLKTELGGLILHAPFLSCVRTILDIETTFWFDFFPNVDRISKVEVPILIMHGSEDSIISCKDGEKLSKLVKPGLLVDFHIIEGGEHNDLFKSFTYNLHLKLKEYFAFIKEKRKNPSKGANIELEIINNFADKAVKNEKRDLKCLDETSTPLAPSKLKPSNISINNFSSRSLLNDNSQSLINVNSININFNISDSSNINLKQGGNNHKSYLNIHKNSDSLIQTKRVKKPNKKRVMKGMYKNLSKRGFMNKVISNYYSENIQTPTKISQSSLPKSNTTKNAKINIEKPETEQTSIDLNLIREVIRQSLKEENKVENVIEMREEDTSNRPQKILSESQKTLTRLSIDNDEKDVDEGDLSSISEQSSSYYDKISSSYSSHKNIDGCVVDLYEKVNSKLNESMDIVRVRIKEETEKLVKGDVIEEVENSLKIHSECSKKASSDVLRKDNRVKNTKEHERCLKIHRDESVQTKRWKSKKETVMINSKKRDLFSRAATNSCMNLFNFSNLVTEKLGGLWSLDKDDNKNTLQNCNVLSKENKPQPHQSKTKQSTSKTLPAFNRI